MSIFKWFSNLFSSTPTQKKDLYFLSEKALDLIVEYEVGSKSYYNRFLMHPTWPQGASGVTIGIGYDLGYNTESTFRNDWGRFLSDKDLGRLSKVIGIKGRAAKQYIDGVEDIVFPWDASIEVFKKTTLPKFIKETLKAFPQSEKLHPDAFGALVSLVFNRGASMNGSRRAEMRRIRALVPSKDYQGIANEIRSMKRIWENKGLDGLLKRREAEAKMVESCA